MAVNDPNRGADAPQDEGIVDLSDHGRTTPSRRRPARRTTREDLYLPAIVLTLAAAVVIGLQSLAGPRPQPSPDPAVTASQRPFGPSTSPRPSLPAGPPEHLLLGGPSSFEIGGVLVTVTLPAGAEGDYYPSQLVDVSAPDGGITITTTDSTDSLCLRVPIQPPSAAAAAPLPPDGIPGVGAPSGSAFVLDGISGVYMEFTPASGSCHPNHVWDSLVGSIGGRGPNVRLQLWMLDLGDPELVLGRYTLMSEDPTALEGTRQIVASVHVDFDEAT